MSFSVSLNETEFMVRKAFRGAGYHWGEAEEAGKAAVWLARRGLPVLAPVLALLRNAAAQEGPNNTTGACPVRTGLMLADGAMRLPAGESTVIPALRAPQLLLPFLADCAAINSLNMSAQWTGNDFILHGGDLHGEASDAAGEEPVRVVIAAAPAARPAAAPMAAGRRSLTVEPDQWDALGRFAAETYVPASTRSRLAGAGAGVTDND